MRETILWNSITDAVQFIKNKVKSQKKPDYEGIRDPLIYCAQNGDPIAQYQVYGVEYNKENANPELYMPWIEKAANNGYAPAQYDYALHFLYGENLEKDLFKAVSYMEMAAEQGYDEALQRLVSLYATGTLIKKNDARAEFWKRKSKGIKTEEKILPLESWMLEKDEEHKKDNAFEELDVIEKEFQEQKESLFADNFNLVSQEYVIKADQSKSFIVNAGPGTGKTYTLIQRINELVRQGVNEDEIVVLSFTNAVVEEVGKRLVQAVNDENADRVLRRIGQNSVKTFHSFAYWLLKEANKEIDENEWKKVELSFQSMNYEDCLIYGAKLLEQFPDIPQGWKYLIVDEIQDINMGKAMFVIQLLKACISQECAFMLLGDSCQAIYEYISEKNTAGCTISSNQFYQEIINEAKNKSEFVSFKENHRSTTGIQQITEPVREAILAEDKDKYSDLTLKINEEQEIIKIAEIDRFIQYHNNESICLMERNNFQTKLLSIDLLKKGINHKCVLSNNSRLYPSWIGKVFSTCELSTMNLEQFKNQLQVKSIKYNDTDLGRTWNKIAEINHAIGDIIRVSDIIHFLKYNRNYFVQTEEETMNVIVSNIHRSKGLEYDSVLLDQDFVVRNAHKSIDEMKTLYVAITRPRQHLYLLKHENNIRIHRWEERYSNISRGYVSQKTIEGYQLRFIEILAEELYSDYTENDFFFENTDEMKSAQKRINELYENSKIYLQLVKGEKEINSKYAIVTKKKELSSLIGWMPERFTKAMIRVSRGNALPAGFDDIFIDGVFTHIGEQEETLHMKEIIADNQDNIYAKTSVWNYVKFSGPCHAIYGE